MHLLTDVEVAQMSLPDHEMKRLAQDPAHIAGKMMSLTLPTKDTAGVKVPLDAYQRLRHFTANSGLSMLHVITILLGWSLPRPDLTSRTAARPPEVDDVLALLAEQKSGLFNVNEQALSWEYLASSENGEPQPMQTVMYARHRVVDYFLRVYTNKTGIPARDVITALILFYLPPASIHYAPKRRRQRRF
jgi:hypothetical protein